jgi:hypothetical protein
MKSQAPVTQPLDRQALESSPSGVGSALGSCGYLIFILIMSAGMLVVNSLLCLSVYSVFTIVGPSAIVDNPQLAPYIGQLFFFLVPVLLTLLEWNLLDRLNRLFWRRV